MVQASIIYITLALALLPSFGTALLGFVLRQTTTHSSCM